MLSQLPMPRTDAEENPTPKRLANRFEAGWSIIDIMIGGACIAIFALIVTGIAPYARNTTSADACLSNLRELATSFEQFHTATNKYPTGTNASITPALLTNPTVATVSYLPGTPIDPADPTQAAPYTYTYTAPTATVSENYTITCPGLHPKETLTAIPGGSSESTGTLQYSSKTSAISAL